MPENKPDANVSEANNPVNAQPNDDEIIKKKIEFLQDRELVVRDYTKKRRSSVQFSTEPRNEHESVTESRNTLILPRQLQKALDKKKAQNRPINPQFGQAASQVDAETAIQYSGGARKQIPSRKKSQKKKRSRKSKKN